MVSAYCTVRVPVEDDTGLEYPTWEAFRRSYTSIAWRFGHSPRRSPRLLDCCWRGMVFSGMRSGAAYFHVYSLGIFVDIRVRCTSIFFLGIAGRTRHVFFAGLGVLYSVIHMHVLFLLGGGPASSSLATGLIATSGRVVWQSGWNCKSYGIA